MPDDSEKKAAPGWYIDKRWPDEQRRWDGAKWLDQWRPTPGSSGWTPEGFMLAGFLLALGLGIAAVIAFAVNESAGWLALWVAAGIAGIVFNIGVIGKAVEVGVRAARR